MKKDEIRVAICDDEPEILKEIGRRVKLFSDKKACQMQITLFNQPESLIEAMEKEEIEICLLDIDMPRISGMDIARMINEKKLSVILIFVTGQDSLVYESFQYHPFSFIRKSMLDVELDNTLYRALQCIWERETIVLQKGLEQIRLELSKIMYIEADGNYVKICTATEKIRYRATMSHMEDVFANKGFVRIHKGFLVNEKAVYRIGTSELVLTNEEVLPIGRSNREQVRTQLIKSFRN